MWENSENNQGEARGFIVMFKEAQDDKQKMELLKQHPKICGAMMGKAKKKCVRDRECRSNVRDMLEQGLPVLIHITGTHPGVFWAYTQE